MNWFLTTIVFSVTYSSSPSQPQLREEQRLVSARSGEEAFLKAKRIGLDLETSDLATASVANALEFINVAEVKPIAECADGLTLGAVEKPTFNPHTVKAIHQRALQLRHQLTE